MLNENLATVQTVLASKRVKFISFAGAANLPVSLGNTPSSSLYGNVIVINPNANIFSTIYFSGNAPTIRDYGSTAVSASVSGSTMTVTRSDSGTIWGNSLVIVSANYDLY